MPLSSHDGVAGERGEEGASKLSSGQRLKTCRLPTHYNNSHGDDTRQCRCGSCVCITYTCGLVAYLLRLIN